MDKSQEDELMNFLRKSNSHAEGIFMNPVDLVFEESVKMNCYYCGKYNNNWRCPPHPSNINFEKMTREYDKGMFVILSYKITGKSEFETIRSESGIVLHKLLLSLEKWLYNHNSPTAISFIGGSCKLCRGGCGKLKCNNPYMSRSPLESIGVHVIKSAEKYGIEIKFPPENNMKRLGLLLWQE